MKQSRILLLLASSVVLVVLALLLVPGHRAYAECNGCQPTVEPETMVCTSSCNSEGYRISVVKQVPGGPALPAECSLHGVSAAGQYIILEHIPQTRIYGQTEYPGISSNPNFHILGVESHVVGPNDQVCDVHGNPIYNGTYFKVTMSIQQTIVACYPAREDTIDCGSYDFMAQRYDAHAQTPVADRLKPCGDDCKEIPEGGTGGEGLNHVTPHGGVDAQWENGDSIGDELHTTGGGSHVTHGTAVQHTTTGVKPSGTGGPLSHATMGAPTTSTISVDTERQACLRKGGTASMTTGKVICVLPQTKTPPSKTAGAPGKR